MNDKKLIRRALMGNKQAQRECTENGIVLPCPFCGGNKIKTPYVCGDHFIECSSCHSASNIVSSRKQALKLWNTRPAPSIGRCGECKYFYSCISETGCTNPLGMYQTELTEIDYCSYFKPKEESR